jgi:hypothetical protein
MKMILLPLLLFSAVAVAQKPPASADIGTPPTYQAGKVCDATYAVEVETVDHFNVSSAQGSAYSIPWVDVEDNHKKQMRVLDALSKEQDKGGQYEITVTETNTCEDGVTVRVADGSAYVTGVTLDGSVKVGDVAIQVMKEINDRYRNRAAKGAKVGWDHSKAPKVKRDDLGRKLKKGE